MMKTKKKMPRITNLKTIYVLYQVEGKINDCDWRQSDQMKKSGDKNFISKSPLLSPLPHCLLKIAESSKTVF